MANFIRIIFGLMFSVDKACELVMFAYKESFLAESFIVGVVVSDNTEVGRSVIMS